MIKQLLISLIASGVLYSQTSTPIEIKADYDFAQFRGSENQTILEIYYAIARESLSHISSDDGFIGTYKITFYISHEGEEITSIDWLGSDRVNSLSDISSGQTINDVKALLFKPGKYNFQIVIADLNNGTEFKYLREMVIRDFSGSEYHFSDIQFSYNIEKAESVNRFVKNGYQSTPNPTLVYNTSAPIMFYYMELYNLDKFETKSEVSLVPFITNQNNEIVKTLPVTSINPENESVVIVNKVYVGALFTGVYSLNFNLINTEAEDTVRHNKQFYIYRPADKVTIAKTNKADQKRANPYAFMSEAELDREFEYLKYTIDDDAKDRYEELNLTGKREYLNIFWIEKEEAYPGYRKELFERIEFANARYTVGNKDGWRTQMGRVLIMYGIPDDIERERSVQTLRNYEIWSYQNIQGGSTFAFVNVSGYGEFRLVHSTVMDEIKDYEWMNRYLR